LSRLLGGESCRCWQRRGKPRLYEDDGALRGSFHSLLQALQVHPCMYSNVSDIERLATGALRLLEISDAFDIEAVPFPKTYPDLN
jgi:hypothetical protein